MSIRIVSFGDDDYEVTLEPSGARTDGKFAALIAIDDERATLRIGDRVVTVSYLVRGSDVEFMLDGETYRASVADKSGRKKSRHREHSMSAPMPGVVLKLFVNEGDRVTKGAPLMILEAMKMEHQIVAPYDGTVSKIACSVGELVQPGVDLVTVDPEETE